MSLDVLQLSLPLADEAQGADDQAVAVTHDVELADTIPVTYEPVGRWFDLFMATHQRRMAGDASDHDDDEEEADANDGPDDEDSQDSRVDVPDDIAAYVKIEPGEWKNQDHYALLGLGELRWRATDDDIRKAYRKAVLKHHPDKKGDLSPDEAEKAAAAFDCIQKAFDLLSDKAKRRLYDSVDDVDDTVPERTKDTKEFYEEFKPAFERNAKWLIKQPVLTLGDETTDIDTVFKFYDFWYNAKSWREFGYDDEEDPSQAETRDERRWMERRLKAERKKKKKAENARMLRLIDNAYHSDPRVRRYKEEQERKKKEAKERRRRERQEQEERRLRAEKEEAEAKAREEAARREEEKRRNEIAKKLRRAFTKSCKRVGMYDPEHPATAAEAEASSKNILTRDDVEKIKAMGVDILRELVDIEDNTEFENRVLGLLKRERKKEEKKKAELEAAKRPWTEEEQQALEQAMRQVPKTADDRWGKVAELVPGRSKRECVLRIKELAQKVREKKENPQVPAQWTPEEETVLAKAASKVYPPGTQGDRYGLIAEYVKIHAKTEWLRDSKDVIAKVNAMKKIAGGGGKKATGNDFETFKKRQMPKANVTAEPTTRQ